MPTSSYFLTIKNLYNLQTYSWGCCIPHTFPHVKEESLDSGEVEAYQKKVNAQLAPLCEFANAAMVVEKEYVHRALDILLQCCDLGETCRE